MTLSRQWGIVCWRQPGEQSLPPGIVNVNAGHPHMTCHRWTSQTMTLTFGILGRWYWTEPQPQCQICQTDTPHTCFAQLHPGSTQAHKTHMPTCQPWSGTGRASKQCRSSGPSVPGSALARTFGTRCSQVQVQTCQPHTLHMQCRFQHHCNGLGCTAHTGERLSHLGSVPWYSRSMQMRLPLACGGQRRTGGNLSPL